METWLLLTKSVTVAGHAEHCLVNAVDHYCRVRTWYYDKLLSV